MKIPFFAPCFLAAFGLVIPTAEAADTKKSRDEMVLEDRDELSKDDSWIYNDLAKAKETAKEVGKPLMIVFRCIP